MKPADSSKNTRFQRLLVAVFVLASLCSIAVYAYRDFTLLSQPPEKAEGSINSAEQGHHSQQQPNSGTNGRDNVVSTANAGLLFGKQAEVVATAPSKQEDIPDTRLQLQLFGTWTNRDERKAHALIAVQNSPAKSFGIGDTITRGAKLVEVRPGEVVLQRNGRNELLKLPIFKELTAEQRRQMANRRPYRQPPRQYRKPPHRYKRTGYSNQYAAPPQKVPEPMGPETIEPETIEPETTYDGDSIDGGTSEEEDDSIDGEATDEGTMDESTRDEDDSNEDKDEDHEGQMD